MRKTPDIFTWLIASALLSVCVTAPQPVLAAPPTIDSAPLEGGADILDLEPLDLTSSAHASEATTSWTRRRLRHWLWRERASLLECVDALDASAPAVHPQTMSRAHQVQLTLRLQPESSRAEATWRDHASEELDACVSRTLARLPYRPSAPTSYTITLEKRPHDRSIQFHHRALPTLELQGAEFGKATTYDSLPVTSTPSDFTPPTRQSVRGHRIAEQLGRLRDTLEACYREALSRNPDVRGRAVVSLKLDKKGRPRSLQWEKNELGDARFLECAAREISDYRVYIDSPTDQTISAAWDFDNSPTRPAMTTGVLSAAALARGRTDDVQIDTDIYTDTALGAVYKRWAACHKLHAPKGSPAGALHARLHLDLRRSEIIHATIRHDASAHDALTSCMERVSEGHKFRGDASLPTDVIVVLDQGVEFTHARPSPKRLDEALERRLLSSSPPLPPHELLGPTRSHDERFIERAALVYAANGHTAHAITLYAELTTQAHDAISRLSHLDRALVLAREDAHPTLYHELLFDLATRSAPIGLAPALVARQADATIRSHLLTELQRTHSLIDMDTPSEPLTKASLTLHDLYLKRYPGMVPSSVLSSHIDLLETQSRYDDALESARDLLSSSLTPTQKSALIERMAHLARARYTQRITPLEGAGIPIPTSALTPYTRLIDELLTHSRDFSDVQAAALARLIDDLNNGGFEERASKRLEQLHREFEPISIPARYSP